MVKYVYQKKERIIMNKELKSIIKTEHQLKDLGYSIENNIIEKVNVNTIARFGNVTSFEIYCQNVIPYSGYNNISNIGYVIQSFIELMDLSEENGIRLDKIINIPCRIVYEGHGGWGSRVVGIGHFMKDQFVLCDDLAKVGIEVNENE